MSDATIRLVDMDEACQLIAILRSELTAAKAANERHLLERNRYAIERDGARSQLSEAQKRIAELEKSLRHLANRSAIYCEQDECCQRRSNAFKVSQDNADDDCITCQIEKAMNERKRITPLTPPPHTLTAIKERGV